MDEQELLKERFKSAVSSTVKAISENFDLEIKFGSSETSKKKFLESAWSSTFKKITRFYKFKSLCRLRGFKNKIYKQENLSQK